MARPREPSSPPAGRPCLGPAYGDAEVEALGREVVPRYLRFFNRLAIDSIMPVSGAAAGLFGPIASSLGAGAKERLPGAPITAFEPSEAGVRAALARADGIPVERCATLPIQRGDASLTHAVAVHPIVAPGDRLALLRDLRRVLVVSGQLVVVVPLRGSYPEVSDMLREYALKHDATKLAEAVEIAAQSRPTPETLTDEIEIAGYDDVSVEVDLICVPFRSGRDFAAHALLSLVVAPDVANALGLPSDVVGPAIEYVQTAIGTYWSEGQFDLTVNLGCATARRAG
jgi:hypothetical protein